MKTKSFLLKWLLPGVGGILTATLLLRLPGERGSRRDPSLDHFLSSLAQNQGGGATETDGEADAGRALDRQKFADIARVLAEYLPEIHLLHKPFDPAMSATAWTNYLQSLDYQRKYFIQADIDEFLPDQHAIPAFLAAGTHACSIGHATAWPLWNAR